MSSGGESISLLEPSTPTPSTSSLSIAQQQQQQLQPQLEGIQEAFQIPHILSSAVFSILWLFGLARNLASYVVSLGIIPLQTATQLFGLKAHPHPTTNIHLKRDDADRRPGSRHTHLSRSEKTTAPATGITSVSSERQNTHHNGNGNSHGWASHKPGKHSPLSSTDSTTRSGSVPSTPRQRVRTSLPSVEPAGHTGHATDSEVHHPQIRTRHTAPTSRTVVFQDPAVNEQGELVDAEGKRARSRSRVDHSTRRILFVDPKNARRQTAPPVPYNQPLPSSGGNPDEETTNLTESPAHETIALPSTRSKDTKTPRPKSSPEQIPSTATTTAANEFGEFVSAPAPVNPIALPHDDHDVAASGTESLSERKSRGKERFRSGFRLFAKKRSSSVASNGDAPAPAPAPATSGHASDAATGSTGPYVNKLRRKSPYPGRVDSHHSMNGHMVANGLVAVAPAMAVSVSDAETPSTAWLRSRPKKLTRKARSNSLSEGARVKRPEDTSSSSTTTAAQTQTSNVPAATPVPTPALPNQSPPIPLLRSSTMASTSTSASASSSTAKDPSTTTNPSSSTSASASSKRSSFNLSDPSATSKRTSTTATESALGQRHTTYRRT